jgi:hypothetical protein
VPFPGDFIVGTYYPWLDYKWGYEAGVPVKNPILSDVASLVWPRRSLAVDIIKSGQFPLWNRHSFTGYPLFAIYPTGVMSPTFFLYFLLPKIWAWTTQVILQHILAALFTYLFLRHLKLSRFSSMFGGIVYAFAGFNMVWSQWNSHTLVAAWIPLLLYITDRFIGTKRRLWGALLSIVLAIQIFSGYPQIVIYSVPAILFWALIRSRNNRVYVLSWTFMFVVLGLLLTSIQTFPATELFINSQRATEVLDKDLIFLPIQNLITLFAPDYFGNHATGNYWGVGNYTLNTAYTGLVVFILATIGLFVYRSKVVIRFFLFIFLVCLFLSLESPISVLITSLPFVGGAASPTRMLVLVNLALCVMAAYGVESLFKEKIFSVFRVIALPATAILGTFLGSAFLYFKSPSFLETGYNLQVGIRNLVLPLALLSFVLIALFLYKRVLVFRKVIAWGIVVLAIIELYRFGWKYTPFSKVEYVYPTTPSIEYVKETKQPNRLITVNTIPANMWSVYGLESAAGYDNLYSKLYAKYVAVLNSGRIDATPQNRYATIETYSGKMVNILNVRYFFIDNNQESEYADFAIDDSKKELFSDKSVTIFENTKALPRAKLYYNWVIGESDEGVLNILQSDDFDEQNKVVLSKSIGASSENSGESSVKYLNYSDNFQKLKVNTSKDGYLFASDTHYPGWRAYVDGIETEILRANYAFRALSIKQGEHEVEFIYDPKSFKIGKQVSLGTFIFLVGSLVYGKKNKKRGRTS